MRILYRDATLGATATLRLESPAVSGMMVGVHDEPPSASAWSRRKVNSEIG
jgi:hypothetical protein